MSKRYTVVWWGLLAALVIAAAVPSVPWEAIAASGGTQSEPVLIIDAGHGGADGGAIAADGTPESEINLDIALRVEALAHFCGVRTEMTRRTRDIDYPADAQTLSQMKKWDQNERLRLINSLPDAVLLSIHQNNYPATSPCGIQVFYNGMTGSDAFAVLLQGNLTASLCPDNRRVAEVADEGIYLMRRSEHPAALVECGFLSNPAELEKLESDGYRTQLAVVMVASWLQYIRGTEI